MKINIIHLPHRKDRLIDLETQLSEQGVTQYELWPGIINPYNRATGISQAHKQIVKYAKFQQLQEILIAEDDLKFTDSGAFNFFLKNKPEDFDLYLSSIYYGEIAEGNSVNDFSGLTFYIINQRFYDKFISVPEHDNIDRLLRNCGKYIVNNPFSVIQQPGFSDNILEYCNYEKYLKTRKLFNKLKDC